MIKINLEAIPNQVVQYDTDDYSYKIRLFLCGDIMSYDLQRDEEYIIRAGKLNPYGQLIPYSYELKDGNFFISTNNDNLVDYTKFNDTQYLYYATSEQFAEFISEYNDG